MQRKNGTIKAIHPNGFGFIKQDEGPDLFFHCRCLADGLEFDDTLVRRSVSYTVTTGDGGRLRAVDVQPAL